MPLTRYADTPVIKNASLTLNPLNVETSITLPGQCFGLQIGVGNAWSSDVSNFVLAKIAFTSGLVATGISPHFTIYSRRRNGSNAVEQTRYGNFQTFIRLPRNKFVRDLTVYAAFDATAISGSTVVLQAIYWTTPTP